MGTGILLGAVLAFSPSDETPLGTFQMGEKLRYEVKYDLYINVPVGEMVFNLHDEIKNFNGQECFHFSATGTTYRFYDAFFKVRDQFHSYVGINDFEPRLFTRDILEGKYKKQDYIIFNPEKKEAKTKKGEVYTIQDNTWDILSVWYLARTFDYDAMTVGHKLDMYTFIDDESYPIGLEYLGKEVVKTELGKIECHVIKPLLIVGELFKSEGEMTLWVSADKNKIPVIIESGISVGSVRAELVGHQYLKHSFTALKK